MKAPYVCSSILSLFLFAGCSPVERNATVVKNPNPEIVSKLETIIQVRERQLKEQEILMDLGRGDSIDLGDAVTVLSEAKIALATELNQPEKVIADLQKIVKIRKEILKREELLAEEDRETMTELGDRRISVLEADVQLLRAKQKIQD